MMLILSHSQFTQQCSNIALSFQLIFPSFVIAVMQTVWRVKIIQMQIFSCSGMKSCLTKNSSNNLRPAHWKTRCRWNSIIVLNIVSFTILGLMKPEVSWRPLIMKWTNMEQRWFLNSVQLYLYPFINHYLSLKHAVSIFTQSKIKQS